MEVVPDSTLEVLQSAALSEDQAEAIFEQGRATVVFALLELSKRLAEARGPQTTPNTPSGMIPVYEKPPAKPRKKRPSEDWAPLCQKAQAADRRRDSFVAPTRRVDGRTIPASP